MDAIYYAARRGIFVLFVDLHQSVAVSFLKTELVRYFDCKSQDIRLYYGSVLIEDGLLPKVYGMIPRFSNRAYVLEIKLKMDNGEFEPLEE